MPMTKNKQLDEKKVKRYVNMYPKEFTVGVGLSLYCNICSTIVDHNKKHKVDSHRTSKKHSTRISSGNIQTFLSDPHPEFTRKVVNAFLSADIPLEKLRNKALKDLFESMNYKLPSETNARRQVELLACKMKKDIMYTIKDKRIFLIFDETEISSRKYCNTICGCINNPNCTWLISSKPIGNSLNSTMVIDIIDNILEEYNIKMDNFTLLISDAASYMVKADKILKSRDYKVLHVKCMAHLIHNCAMRIRAFFVDVDGLIGSMKLLTHKNNERKHLFSEIGSPPDIIVTRWSSWLKATMHYCENLPHIKTIVSAIKDSGILTDRAKKALMKDKLVQDLISIKSCYEILIDVLDELESNRHDIYSIVKRLTALDFKNDPVGVKAYIIDRLLTNDILKITELKDESISPSIYHDLLRCPPTSIAVERSFSMLKKILVCGRNFRPENIEHYIIVYFNKEGINGVCEDEQ